METALNSFVSISSINPSGLTLKIHRSRRKEFKIELFEINKFDNVQHLLPILPIKTPDELLRAIQKMETDNNCNFINQEFVYELAKLDWIIAAILSKKIEMKIPPVPHYVIFNKQNSLRAIKSVEIAVPWYYEWHYLNISFEKWIRIINGEELTKASCYASDGKRTTAYWTLGVNNKPQIQIPTCWEGDFASASSFKGPIKESFDLALLTLESFESCKPSSHCAAGDKTLTVTFIPHSRSS